MTESHNSFYKLYGDENKCFAPGDNVNIFGEEVIGTHRIKTKAKMQDRGVKCLLPEYTANR